MDIDFEDESNQFQLRWTEVDDSKVVDRAIPDAPTTNPLERPIQLLNIRFLQSMPEISANIQGDVLASFLKQTTVTIEIALPRMTGHYEMIVQLSLAPDATPQFEVATSAMPDYFDPALLVNLAALESPPCAGPVKVAIQYRVSLEKAVGNSEH